MSESCAAAVGKTKGRRETFKKRRQCIIARGGMHVHCDYRRLCVLKIMASSDGESQHQELVVCGG